MLLVQVQTKLKEWLLSKYFYILKQFSYKMAVWRDNTSLLRLKMGFERKCIIVSYKTDNA